VYMCTLRGRLMEEAQSSDIAAIGDQVKISILEQDESGLKGVIEAVAEREGVLSRAVRTVGKRGGGEPEREHVIVANADQLVFVFAAAQPAPDLHLLDRFLVAGEVSGVEDLIIVVNKVDLEDPTNIERIFNPYVKMGYTLMQTSAKDSRGIEPLRKILEGKISAFTGPSGVGKTSLLNLIQPGLARQVKQVSKTLQEGMHTTRDSALIKLEGGDFVEKSYLADTPGMRQLNVYDIEPEELDAYFVDLAEHVGDCRFSDCTHTNETKCGVKQAGKAGLITRTRYQSYRKLREELEATLAAYY